MDTLSHALWGYGVFVYKRYAVLAIFFWCNARFNLVWRIHGEESH